MVTFPVEHQKLRSKFVIDKAIAWLVAWRFVFGLFLLTGCTSLPKPNAESESRIRAVTAQLTALNERVDQDEAGKLARVAVSKSMQLAHQYKTVRPPWLHNVLVNHGLKERGLCFEWTNDLFLRLLDLNLRSLDLHLAVARMDTSREHNAIVVTASGQPFESGIVLDAWRHSGRLWAGEAMSDKYPWVPLPPDRVNPEIKQRL